MPKDFPGVTAWILLLMLFVIGIYDFFAALYMPQGSTVSAYIHALSVRHPVVPFFAGVVMGHLLWPPATARAIVDAVIKQG